MQPHIGRDAMRREMLLRRRANRVVMAENLDALVLRDDSRDLGVYPRENAELTRPVRLVVRPGDPGGVVRMPLGGEGELGQRSFTVYGLSLIHISEPTRQAE